MHEQQRKWENAFTKKRKCGQTVVFDVLDVQAERIETTRNANYNGTLL
jgi:hypothetical protein